MVFGAVALKCNAIFPNLPPLQGQFGSAPLDARAWLVSALAGVIILPVISVEKRFRRKRGQ